MWPSQRLIPRLFLQSDIIVSGQRAGDSFLVPVAAMVTVRRGSSLHNPTVLSNPGLVGFAEIAPSPFGAIFIAAGAPRAQYPSCLLTMFFKGSPFSNLPYCFRKKPIA